MKKQKVVASVLSMMMLGRTLVTPVSAASSRVETIISNMTRKQKVEQMLMVDFRYWDEDTSDGVQNKAFTVMNDQVRQIVEDYNFGSVIYFAQNIQETEQSFNLTKDLQEAATKDGGIAMLISADQEGGSVYRLGSGTALPGNMALGATGDASYSEKAGEIIGSELSVLGINTNLAPCVDVNNNANNPVIGLRSYSDDANIVSQMAVASIKGMKKYNVIGCVKHFPGHGDTATDSHYGLPLVNKTKDELMENELKPYKDSLSQGVEMVMTAHIIYPQLESDKIKSEKTGQEESLPATLSDDIITGLLKGEFGFDGIVCSDAMNMAGVSATWDQVQAAKLSIAAGMDMLCMPCELKSLDDLANLDTIINGIVEDTEMIPDERLNDACRRILTVKENRGILDYNPANYSLEKANAVVGSNENRELERTIAASAVTVVKNENNTLPLRINENSKVLMLCPYNNEKAQMIMGWNRAKEAGLIPDGAEVKVIRYASAAMTEEIKGGLDWADTVIINSEVSSAARMGYKHWLSQGPNDFSTYCKQNNKKSIIMSVDKPYDVQLYPNADAILAAYGCKGSSVDVTEALTGGVTSSKAAYGPNIIAGVEVALGTFGAKGKLPVAIPEYNSETRSYNDTIVYQRGYGLTYDSLITDKSQLEEVINTNKDLDTSKYTDESVKAYLEAFNKAKEVFENEDATQTEIDQAISDLNAAKDALKEKVVVEPGTETPGKEETKKPSNEENKGSKVETGDNTSIAGFVSMAAAAFILGVYLKRRRVND